MNPIRKRTFYYIVGGSALVMLFLALFMMGNTTASATKAVPVARETVQDNGYLTGPNRGRALDIAMRYLDENREAYGLSIKDIANLEVDDIYRSSNGVTHIFLQQRYRGIEVYNGIININVAEDGSIMNVGNRFAPRISEATTSKNAGLTANQAVRSAANHLGLTINNKGLEVRQSAMGDAQSQVFSPAGIARQDITAELVYLPLEDGSVRLAWNVEIYELAREDWWFLRVDAETGAVLDKSNLVIHDNFGAPAAATNDMVQQEAAPQEAAATNNAVNDGSSYNVLALPAESLSHGGRSIVSNPADATASPYGWHDTNGANGAEYTYTRGNNAYAYEDGNNSNSAGFTPNGGSGLDFDFTLNLSQHPDNYEAAAVTNLFYMSNVIHDIMYQYGFDEASGNFQENNYGRGGSGSDSVNAEAQDGGGTNNANFATPPDGSNPRMQMYLWSTTNPYRDGDFDNGIIIHEYGHGISTRLTGGRNNSSCLNNAEQGGEGWSDYFGLVLTTEAGAAGTDRRGIGTYALGQPTSGDGIRDYPYSTSMSIDPRTYNEIKTAAVPHGVGSTWAAMLWEMHWALIDVHGYDADLYTGTGGNNIAMQLVIDGLKLQPCSPGFVDARDAILLADQNNNGGANQCVIWEAFAKRGLGYSATQGSSGSRSDGSEAFDLPSACSNPGPTPTATPGTVSCTTYSSGDIPKSLPNGTASVSSVLNVSGSDTIVDLNVIVNATHPWVGDLSLTLAKQNTGTSVQIMNRPGVPASNYGCSGDNIGATFDDEAGTSVESSCASSAPTINGSVSPNNALSAFDGQSGNGTWVLTMADAYTSADAGTLNSWSVEICVDNGGSNPQPTATSVPPTATSVPPTATSVPPTATPLPPTATPVPPTATPVPPTATPVPPTATPIPDGGPCTGCEQYSGTLTGNGDADYQPNGTYYYSSGSGTHQGWLEGPAGTDFDLYLQKWNGSGWSNVASSLTSSSSESVTYNGTSGYYVWRVYSYSGSGSYDFYMERP
ncbi:MAG TPA: M36 family metallopeptidase [Anaerolineae bacterium]|nr:M36 family metallopeptidase [Anaerolineae bacterium]